MPSDPATVLIPVGFPSQEDPPLCRMAVLRLPKLEWLRISIPLGAAGIYTPEFLPRIRATLKYVLQSSCVGLSQSPCTWWSAPLCGLLLFLHLILHSPTNFFFLIKHFYMNSCLRISCLRIEFLSQNLLHESLVLQVNPT